MCNILYSHHVASTSASRRVAVTATTNSADSDLINKMSVPQSISDLTNPALRGERPAKTYLARDDGLDLNLEVEPIEYPNFDIGFTIGDVPSPKYKEFLIKTLFRSSIHNSTINININHCPCEKETRRRTLPFDTMSTIKRV